MSKMQNYIQMKSSSLIYRIFAKSNFGMLNFLAFKRWDVRLRPDAVPGPEITPSRCLAGGLWEKRTQEI